MHWHEGWASCHRGARLVFGLSHGGGLIKVFRRSGSSGWSQVLRRYQDNDVHEVGGPGGSSSWGRVGWSGSSGGSGHTRSGSRGYSRSTDSGYPCCGEQLGDGVCFQRIEVPVRIYQLL